MALYRATFTFQDEINGETTRSWEGDFADDAAANTAVGNLVTDVAAFTTSKLLDVWLAKKVVTVTSAAAGSRVFENARINVELDDTAKYSLDFPSPDGAVFSGNTLQTANTLVTDFIANFEGQGWKVSDGQEISSILGGKRIFKASGKTNLT